MTTDARDVEPRTPPALGPGDPDPAFVVTAAAPIVPALGPGDADGSPQQAGALATPAAGPGDGDDDGYDTVTPAAPGPGDTASPRVLVRIPRKTRHEAPPPVADDNEGER